MIPERSEQELEEVVAAMLRKHEGQCHVYMAAHIARAILAPKELPEAVNRWAQVAWASRDNLSGGVCSRCVSSLLSEALGVPGKTRPNREVLRVVADDWERRYTAAHIVTSATAKSWRDMLFPELKDTP